MPRSRRVGDPALGQRIARLMAERGIIPTEFSARTGISEGYLSRILNGKMTNPTLDLLLRIARGLGEGITVNDLLDDTTSPRPVPSTSPMTHRAPSTGPALVAPVDHRQLAAGGNIVGERIERIIAGAQLTEGEREIVSEALLRMTEQCLILIERSRRLHGGHTNQR